MNDIREIKCEACPRVCPEDYQKMVEKYSRACQERDRANELLQKGQECNDPLTLDELRKMDGEPVWIVDYPDWGHWELSADAEDYVTDREPSFYGMKHNDPDGRYDLHKLGWLAYRQKPEDDDHAERRF